MGLHGAELFLVWVLWVVVLKQMELLGKRFTVSALSVLVCEMGFLPGFYWGSTKKPQWDALDSKLSVRGRSAAMPATWPTSFLLGPSSTFIQHSVTYFCVMEDRRPTNT